MGRYLQAVFIAVLLLWPGQSISAEEFEWLSVGIRGAVNFKDAGLPPGEKVDFEQFDVVGVLGFPGRWEIPGNWHARYQLNTTAGSVEGR